LFVGARAFGDAEQVAGAELAKPAAEPVKVVFLKASALGAELTGS